jgi:ATP-dependent DNA helicase PIF1
MMTILVEPMSWQLEDEGKVKAEITQVPLRLAWAITVHKKPRHEH